MSTYGGLQTAKESAYKSKRFSASQSVTQDLLSLTAEMVLPPIMPKHIFKISYSQYIFNFELTMRVLYLCA